MDIVRGMLSGKRRRGRPKTSWHENLPNGVDCAHERTIDSTNQRTCTAEIGGSYVVQPTLGSRQVKARQGPAIALADSDAKQMAVITCLFFLSVPMANC